MELQVMLVEMEVGVVLYCGQVQIGVELGSVHWEQVRVLILVGVKVVVKVRYRWR